MKRIVVYSTQLMETGGIESHLLEFCTHISQEDIFIDLIVLNSSVLPETEETYGKVCNRVFLGTKGRSFWRVIWLIVVCLKLQRNKYDSLYTNGQGKSIGLIGSILRIKGPWVHHHHTSGDKEDQKTWGKSYKKVLEKSADTVIACSSLNAKSMSSFLKTPIQTIPCFSRKITVPHAQIKKNGVVKIGYYGRLIPEKGIDTLCKMSKDDDLLNIEFHIWGRGETYPPSYFDKFPEVHYHGSFSGLTGLSQTISTIDAFALLSVHPEGLPICLLEAMGAGLPWIATDRGGIPDIAVDPVSTRVVPFNATYDQMKQALKLLAEDISKGKISREVQKRIYTEKFSSTALVIRWMDALKLNQPIK